MAFLRANCDFFVVERLPRGRARELLYRCVRSDFPPVLSIFQLVNIRARPLSGLCVQFNVISGRHFDKGGQNVFCRPIRSNNVQLHRPGFVKDVRFIRVDKCEAANKNRHLTPHPQLSGQVHVTRRVGLVFLSRLWRRVRLMLQSVNGGARPNVFSFVVEGLLTNVLTWLTTRDVGVSLSVLRFGRGTFLLVEVRRLFYVLRSCFLGSTCDLIVIRISRSTSRVGCCISSSFRVLYMVLAGLRGDIQAAGWGG